MDNPATSSIVGGVSVRALITLIPFAALWFVFWRQLSGEWSVNDQYSYGWFVPFFAAFLFWLRWESASAELPARNGFGVPMATARQRDRPDPSPPRKPTLAWILIGVPALLVLLPIRLFEIGTPEWRPLAWIHAASVATLTLLYIWSAGGKPWLRHFAFPIAFTFVAIPWITPVEAPVIQGLMRAIATAASETLNLFGIPARLEGNLIRVSSGLVGVNEACSGVRSLQTSLMIGLLFGELKRLRKDSRAPMISGLSILRRVALVAGAITIALIANFGRTLFLVWIAATKNVSEVSRWHDLAGYSIVAVVFIGSLLLVYLLGKSERRDQRSDVSLLRAKAAAAAVRSQKTVVAGVPPAMNLVLQPASGRPPLQLSSSYFFIPALCWLIAVEVAAAAWYRAHESNLIANARWEVQWPANAPNFHEVKIDEEVRRTLRFNQGHAASWILPAPNPPDAMNAATPKPLACLLYFFRWDSGKNSALLANLHRPDVCLPAIGWNQVADTGVKIYPVSNTIALPFRHFEFRHGGRDESTQQVAHGFYCLWEDRAPASSLSASQLPQMTTTPSTWTRGERMRAILEGRRHLGQQVMELVMQTRGPVDVDQVEARFAQVLPELVRVTSDTPTPKLQRAGK